MENADNVRMMTENPRHSILRMSVPLTVALLISYIQHFVDSVWCAGLGTAAMSAITVSGPLYWIIIDLGIGLGVGVSTSVARALGAQDRERANSLASQAMVLALIIASAATVFLLLTCGPVLDFVNNGGDTALCEAYVYPYFVCVIPIVMHGVLIGMLRAEGASRMVLRLSIVSSLLNLIIDHIFIYTFGWGLSGAAIATCVSFIVPLAVGLGWYLSGRMYVRPAFKGFRIRPDEMKDIMYVGVPHMLELMAISFLMIPQNMIVMRTGGEEGIVLTMTPYKFIILAIMPAQGLSEAMIPVTSALQGAGMNQEAKNGFLFTVKVSTLVCIVLSLFLIVAADPLTWAFTYSGDMADLHDKLAEILRLYGFITLFAGLSHVCSGILQSLRKAMLATITTFVRESVFIGMYIVASGYGMEAIYDCMVLGMFFGFALMGVFAAYCVRHMPLTVPKAEPA